MADADFWKRKLAAFLHDPPEKALDIREHEKRRKTYLTTAFENADDIAWFFDRGCDHKAAAADRFCFPKFPYAASQYDASDYPFHHPLGAVDGSGRLTMKGGLPSADAASEQIRAAQHGLGLEGLSDEDKFWAHWRFWRSACADKHPELAFLPADTRIPDHTIWTHCSVTSALQGCIEIENAGPNASIKSFNPAFLLFQIGPVQEFIAQARKTRDLWSGSYLLSWIIAHAIKAVTDEIGPDAILFPALCGQPLFDFLNKDRYERMKSWECTVDGRSVPIHGDRQILTPNLPNRFLALVPKSRAESLAKSAAAAAQKALDDIASKCWSWLCNECGDGQHKGKVKHPGEKAAARWQQQIKQFLSVHWQVIPWPDGSIDDALKRFEQLPLGVEKAEGATCSPAEALSRVRTASIDGIPDALKDPRNYRHKRGEKGGEWKSELVKADGKAVIDNQGFAWAAHYAETEFALAARRQLRDFEPWGQLQSEPTEDSNLHLEDRHAPKDALSGKEEVIGDKEWQENLAELDGHFFKNGERVGAMTIIKRLWPVVVLEREHKLRRIPRFDSVPAVAAAAWAEATLDAVLENSDACHDLLDFRRAAVKHAKDLEVDIGVSDELRTWLRQTDASVFHDVELQRMESLSEGQRQELLRALRAVYTTVKLKPSRYVAVLAMDGDSMGQWVSGAMSPKWKDQLSRQARTDFFEKDFIDGDQTSGAEARKKLLESPRHVSPSYHLSLSEALGNFAVYLAEPIVRAFHGQLIYAGGDDVLAILPAAEALECARVLRAAFRGDPHLPDQFDGALTLEGVHSGFVALNGKSDIYKPEKRFVPRGIPLVMPGPRTDISAGIAYGHMHNPLQNLVSAAHTALDRAKKSPEKNGYGKAAFSVTLFKRSGETLEWGAKWDTNALELARLFSTHSEQGSGGDKAPLSGRFPYALTELLSPYARPIRTTTPSGEFEVKDWKIAQSDGFDPSQVFPLEIRHVLRRQTSEKWRDTAAFLELEKEIKDYLKHCQGRTLSDFLGPFLTTAFIKRGGEL